jgi:two-component system nitrogen regulation sensor histidine kinase NtrY
VATWIGFYLSRRITGPVQELGAGSARDLRWNLGIRVRAPAGDEVGMLVEAFNEMAARLQESQEVITRGNADLRRSKPGARRAAPLHRDPAAQPLHRRAVARPRTRASPPRTRRRNTSFGSAPAGTLVGDALDGTRAAPVRGVLEEAVRAGRTVREELVLPGAQEVRTVSVSAAPLRGGRGEDLGSLVLLEDLTILLRAQRLAAWREVARRMAHEIKNPLTPIQLAPSGCDGSGRRVPRTSPPSSPRPPPPSSTRWGR